MGVPPWAPARNAYEREVRALSAEARERLGAGESPEIVARALVAKRNALKRRYREQDDPAIVTLMEARNRAKYGDPIGPDADWLFRKYGSWEKVIEAACRPARLGPA